MEVVEDTQHEITHRSKLTRAPLSSSECEKLFDEDGRLVREIRLRKALFEGE